MLLWVRLMVVGPGVARLVVVMLKRPHTGPGAGREARGWGRPAGPACRGPSRFHFKRRSLAPRLRLASLGPVPDLPQGRGAPGGSLGGRHLAVQRAAIRALELCPV